MKNVIPLLLALASTQALAQAPAAPANDMIAPPTCEQPFYPGRTANDKQMDKFNKTLSAYQKCMNEYIEAQKKLAENNVEEQKKFVEELNALTLKQQELKNKVTMSIDRQKRHVDARNQAVNEFNNHMTKLKKDAGQ